MTTLPPRLNTRREIGAGNEIRTRDIHLGKVVLYQLSYSRSMMELVLPQQRMCIVLTPNPSSIAVSVLLPPAGRLKLPIHSMPQAGLKK